MIGSNLRARSLVTLGPKHSGKSVFAYLTFRSARDKGNDAALVDADLFSPTFRSWDLLSDAETKYCYLPPGSNKIDGPIPIHVYDSYIWLVEHDLRQNGLVVWDGLGQHSELSDRLTNCSDRVAVVCRESSTEDDWRAANYLDDAGHAHHPFDFYRDRVKQMIAVTTHKEEFPGRFDPSGPSLEVCQLERESIVKGNVDQFHEGTLSAVKRFVDWILSSRVSGGTKAQRP